MKRKTTPNLLLWEVWYSAYYYDDDPRMPGNVPVDKRVFVLAATNADAISKAEPLFMDFRKRWYKDHKVTATVISLENLVAARDCSRDGRLGYRSTNKWAEVALSSEEDKKNFRLGVCLIPLEK